MTIKVEIIKQLKDNYSYVVYDSNTNEALIIDPAESKPLIDFLTDKGLELKFILITHHHSDHTSGIIDLKKNFNTKVYSPNKNIEGTTNIVADKEKIECGFVLFDVIATPGHTLDHVVFFNNKEKILFSGDTLFQYGCGRIFEGSNEQMLNSLKKIKILSDDVIVFCGHEYTNKNLQFLFSEIISFDKDDLVLKCKNAISKYGSSMPFTLKEQKIWNPFLNCDKPTYRAEIVNFSKNKEKISLESSELEFFTFLREKRNNF